MADLLRRTQIDGWLVVKVIGLILMLTTLYYGLDSRITMNTTAIGNNNQSVTEKLTDIKADLNEIKADVNSMDDKLDTIILNQ